MATTKTAEKKLTEEQLAVLNESFPISTDEASGLKLPRLGMLSKDITETTGSGKMKKVQIIQAAGTFFTEADKGEINEETGKVKWTRDYIEDLSIDVVIVYYRRQLRRFDQSLNKFYSTPIYDNAAQIVPLYLDGQIVKRGNQEQLQALYPKLSQKGKKTSDLKEEAILYVIYDGELYQMNISQSSKWMFKNYKKSLNPSTVITTIGSVSDEFGDNVFSKMTFTSKGLVSAGQFDDIIEKQGVIMAQVEADQKFYLETGGNDALANEELDKLAAGKN